MKGVVFGLTTLLLLLLLSLVLLAGCNREASRTTAPVSPSGINNPATFHSSQGYSSVVLPSGWAAAEGPEAISIKSLEGEVAFSSWGQAGFWAREVVEGNSHKYGPEIMMSQLPAGGAYVALVEINGPAIVGESPPEYLPNDLGGLFTPHDWRQDGLPNAQFTSFYKWGRSLELEIGCKAEASYATVAALNELLQSWRFDAAPAGDPGWAFTLARELLPEQVTPLKFRGHSNIAYDQSVARSSEVNIREDKTVHFRFTYYWNLPATPASGSFDSPSETYHWWEIDVLPNGKASLLSQGGANLP